MMQDLVVALMLLYQNLNYLYFWVPVFRELQ